MKLAAMAISRYCYPKIKLLDFPIYILVIFYFLLLDLPVEDGLAKSIPFWWKKPFFFRTVSVTSKLLLEPVSGLVEKFVEGRMIV